MYAIRQTKLYNSLTVSTPNDLPYEGRQFWGELTAFISNHAAVMALSVRDVEKRKILVRLTVPSLSPGASDDPRC